MRVLFSLLLAIPLALGCWDSKDISDDDDDDWSDDGAATDGWGGGGTGGGTSTDSIDTGHDTGEEAAADADADADADGSVVADDGGDDDGGDDDGGDDDGWVDLNPTDCALEGEIYSEYEGELWEGEESGLVMTSTADMENFCDEYRAITGSLTITGPDVTSLDGLSCLCGVDGRLSLTDSAVVSFRGLDNLEAVDALYIRDNFYLEQIDPSRPLETESLSIDNNLFLSEMEFPSGTQIHNNVTITGNTSLEAVDLAGMVGEAREIEISENTQLGTIDLTGLSAIQHLTISENNNLENLSISTLEAVKDRGRITVASNPRVSALDLPNLRSLSCDVEYPFDCGDWHDNNGICISGNDSLSEFNLPGPIDMDEEEEGGACGFVFYQNNALESLDFSNVSGDATHIELSNNPLLHTIDFSRITSLDSLYIEDQPTLGSVDFGSVTDINSSLSVYEIDGSDLDFDALRTVGGDVVLRRITDLRDVDTFNSLQIIGGDLDIEYNDRLDDLDGLHSVERIGGDFTIQDNPDLSHSEAIDLRDAIGSENIAGEITIEDNGEGGDDTGSWESHSSEE